MSYHRLPTHDYRSRCIYMITMATARRKPLLSRLVGNEDDARTELTPLGAQVAAAIENIPQFYPQIRILSKVVMPDHVHFVLFVTESIPVPLGRVLRGFKQGCNHAYLNSRLESANQQHPSEVSMRGDFQSPTIPPAVPPIAQPPLLPLFEPNFHDRILAGKGQLDAMINYIHDNPRRAIIKRNHPDLFYLRRNTTIQTSIEQLVFSSMGNHFLLDYPLRQRVECSRSMTEEQIQAQLMHVQHLAGKGYVTYMAAISEGERRIARALREAGLPLVILMPEGFPPAGHPNERYFKPQGVYFEACSEGHLLLLEPLAETMRLPFITNLTEQALRQKAEAKHLAYTAIPTDTDRFRFMSLNILAHLLSDR